MDEDECFIDELKCFHGETIIARWGREKLHCVISGTTAKENTRGHRELQKWDQRFQLGIIICVLFGQVYTQKMPMATLSNSISLNSHLVYYMR